MTCRLPRITLCGTINGLLNYISDIAYRRRGALKVDEFVLCAEAYRKWIAGGRGPGPGWYASSYLIDGTFAKCTGGTIELLRRGHTPFVVSDSGQFEEARQALQVTPVTRLFPAPGRSRALLPSPDRSSQAVPRIVQMPRKLKVLR